MLQSFGSIVAETVTGSLSACKRTTEGETFAGQNGTVKTVGETLVFTEEEANFTGAYADIAGGNIRELADMTVKLRHEALAETHYFSIRLALRVKVRSAFAATHRQCGEGVLQNLFKTEELHDREVNRGMEAKATFVRSDGGIILHTEAAVDANIALVIYPGNTELNHTLRLDKTLEKAGLFPFRVLVNDELQRLKHFSHSLKEFGLVGVACFNLCINSFQIFIVH